MNSWKNAGGGPQNPALSVIIIALVTFALGASLFASQKLTIDDSVSSQGNTFVEISRDELESLYKKLNDQEIDLIAMDAELAEKEVELTAKNKELFEISSKFEATTIDRMNAFNSSGINPLLSRGSISSTSMAKKRRLRPLEIPEGDGSNETDAAAKVKAKVAKKKKAKKEKKDAPKGLPLLFERKCKPQDYLKTVIENYEDGSTPNGYSSVQLDWNFNRGLSTVSATVQQDDTLLPVSVAVLTEPTNEAFSVAQLSLSNEVVNQIEAGDKIKYLSYSGQNLTNQRTTSATTVITNLVEYVQDPKTKRYSALTDNISQIYSLVGLESGEVNGCKVFIGSGIDTTTSCSFIIENFGTAVSDMLYIPQENFLIALTDKNVMLAYQITWSGGLPTLNYFGQLDSLTSCYEGNSDESNASDDECNADIPVPRSLSGLYVDEDHTFIYLCSPLGLMVFQLQTDNPSTPLLQLGSGSIAVESCVQSLPTPYGLYVNTQQQVLFLPFQQFDPVKDPVPPFGLLGSEEPDAYVAYQNWVPIESVDTGSSSDEYSGDTYDLITSIAFSGNTNNLIKSVDPITGKTQTFFEGGALFISTVKYDDIVTATTGCVSGSFKKGDYSYGNSCPGSIVINDVCTGENSAFVDDIIDGPVYGMSVDNNMNVLTQNGEGGVSFFSVAYTPGTAQSGVFLENLANPCASKLKTIITILAAAAALVLGLCGGELALVGLAVGTVGAAVPFF